MSPSAMEVCVDYHRKRNVKFDFWKLKEKGIHMAVCIIIIDKSFW